METDSPTWPKTASKRPNAHMSVLHCSLCLGSMCCIAAAICMQCTLYAHFVGSRFQVPHVCMCGICAYGKGPSSRSTHVGFLGRITHFPPGGISPKTRPGLWKWRRSGSGRRAPRAARYRPRGLGRTPREAPGSLRSPLRGPERALGAARSGYGCYALTAPPGG